MANSVKKSIYWKLLSLLLTILLLIGLVFIYGYSEVGSSAGLKSLSIAGLLVSVWITYGVNKFSRPLISPTMISASFTFQMSVLVSYLMAGGTPIISSTIYRPSMAENPIYVVLPLLILPVVTLAVMFFARPVLFELRKQSTLFMDLGDSVETQKLVYYLTVAVGLMFLSTPAVAYFGLLGYFIRILWAAMAMTPILAGWLSSKHRGINYIWTVALGLGVLLALFMGSRGTAFRSIGYFLAGQIIGSSHQQRARETMRIGVVGIILLVVFGFIGNLRNQIGRAGFDDLSGERIASVFESSAQNLSEVQSGESGPGSTVHHGLRRLIVAANLAVPLLTEKGIPTRGTDGLVQEVLDYVDISMLSGSSKRTRLEKGLGSAAATRYGFNITTQTAVPFPVIADGWSRAGLLGAVLFGLFICVVISLLEFVLIHLTSYAPARRSILLCVFGITAFFDVNSSPAFSVLRTLILYLPFTWVCLVGLDFFKRLVTQHRRLRSS